MELDCEYSHTLMEILFNPLNYKMNECADRVSTDKLKCTKHGKQCCHSHSGEERKLVVETIMDQYVPKVLPQDKDVMQQYIDLLPDYMPHETNFSPTMSQKASTQNTSSTSKQTTASISQTNGKKKVPTDTKKGQTIESTVEQEEKKKAAAQNLQEVSNLQR